MKEEESKKSLCSILPFGLHAWVGGEEEGKLCDCGEAKYRDEDYEEE